MIFAEKYGPWAMVAGSAEGLGKAYSRALAKRNINLVLIDHQGKLLDNLAGKLEQEFNIKTLQLHHDLASENAVPAIMELVKSVDCRLLIYNAAYSQIKPFTDHTVEELDQLTEVNIRTPMRLTHAFSNHLINSKQGGGVVLMSSLSGLLGMQLAAPYTASKAFNWNLAESLYHELKAYDIDVMSCIAGIIATPAYLDTNPNYGLFRPYIMQPDAVAEATLDKLGHKNLFIPGFSNRMNYFILMRLLPRRWASWMANRVMAGLYKDKLPSNHRHNKS